MDQAADFILGVEHEETPASEPAAVAVSQPEWYQCHHK
jgi:hypothetical protein